jgi:hypothetical protein
MEDTARERDTRRLALWASVAIVLVVVVPMIVMIATGALAAPDITCPVGETPLTHSACFR